MANIIVPRRKEHFFETNGNPTHRFIAFLEGLTDQTNTNTILIESDTSGAIEVNERLENVELELIKRPLFSHISNTNKRIDQLTTELLEQLEKLNVGSQAQKDTVNLQKDMLLNIKLLNARFEEMAGTHINEDDIEG